MAKTKQKSPGSKVIDKETLYLEFLTYPTKYPTITDLYNKYYLPLAKKKSDRKNKPSKNGDKKKYPSGSFVNLTKGFIDKRKKDIQKKTDNLQKEEVKQIANNKLKDIAIGSEGYLKRYESITDILQYELFVSRRKMQNELAKAQTDKTYEPKSIRLDKGIKVIIEMHRELWKQMRTTLKLPLQYTVNYEEQDTQNSIAGLLRTLMQYKNKQTDIDPYESNS